MPSAAWLCALGLLAAPAASADSSPPHAPTTPISHVVVVTQDGHTFDNYFGRRSGVDGIPAGTCMTSVVVRGCLGPHLIRLGGARSDLGTSAADAATAIDGGRMDGFAQAQGRSPANARRVMGQYPRKALRLLNAIADRAVLFDHWFSGVPAGSIANRLFDITGVSKPDADVVPAGGWTDMRTIFDSLSAAGVSWRIYVEHYEPALTIATANQAQRMGGQLARVPLLSMPRMLRSPDLSSHIVDLSEYYRDAQLNRLPAVSYILTTSSTEHFPQNPAEGQRVVAGVANALLGSPAWQSSAFLLQYDSWGGWYDHVPPPIADGQPEGLRVPALLLSPYTRPNTLDSRVLGAASVLRFIEQNWSLSPLTARDRHARGLLADFRFDRKPARPALIGVAPTPPVRQPARVPLFLGYGLLAGVGIAVVGFTVYRDRPHSRGGAS